MKKKILIFLLVLWIAFIFYNSLQPGHISGANSGRFAYYAGKMLSALKIKFDYNVLAIVIRKLAHIFEFFVLSILFYLILQNYFIFSIQTLFIFIFSVTIAMIDETIQLFVEGRSGSIVDVGIDTIGIVLGIGICCLGSVIFKKRRNKYE
ncbi:MAG: VanZ family protein [Acholeplasmataceae bacterium]|nr:VanZ family protein [Acholeplasmataceae bacterium]